MYVMIIVYHTFVLNMCLLDALTKCVYSIRIVLLNVLPHCPCVFCASFHYVS